MRISGGLARGRQLFCPRGLEVRPAQDKIREAVFNILANVVEGSIVLDLFAGTGALGIEALSRGARQCVFVERDVRAVQALRKNLESTGFATRGTILKRDAFKCLPELQKRGMRFGLVFIDPPYVLWERPKEGQGIFDLVSALGSGGESLLEKDAIAVVRYRTHKVELPESLGNLCLFDKRSYGDTTLAFFRL
ncbi:MAG TPA: 16S rRNA (guanine(966)-N(2))-methyltransferase RsmD [Candidatus Tripitaka californicus]|uniref:16S rRNA (guanine(966)-N(2))-methyltransferase RsmD n=1 Tax=Candidatus Tripitaka californicus TaxID=3367616 RepID=UPI004029673B